MDGSSTSAVAWSSASIAWTIWSQPCRRSLAMPQPRQPHRGWTAGYGQRSAHLFKGRIERSGLRKRLDTKLGAQHGGTAGIQPQGRAPLAKIGMGPHQQLVGAFLRLVMFKHTPAQPDRLMRQALIEEQRTKRERRIIEQQ